MYSEFFKLNGSPFRLNPDHRFFYVAEPHQKAIAHLQYALIRSEGFVVITGEVGAGKTTLVNRMLSELEESRYITGNIVTSYIEHADLIHLVAATFGVRSEGADKATLLLNIRAFLEEQRVLGRHPILFVDEVQNLPESSLEELRMLSNFSLPGESLLQIFLVGQPEFRATLADESMEQLRQRVITACHLGTLDAKDTGNYIAHRLRLANWRGDPSFSLRSFELIHRLSGGVPRRINQICDRLLLYGYLEQIHRIDAMAVAAVARDMTDEGLITAPASVLNPDGEDEDDAELLPAEPEAAAAEPEFQDTPLPEEFLAEFEASGAAAGFSSEPPEDIGEAVISESESDQEEVTETAPRQPLDAREPADGQADEPQLEETTSAAEEGSVDTVAAAMSEPAPSDLPAEAEAPAPEAILAKEPEPDSEAEPDFDEAPEADAELEAVAEQEEISDTASASEEKQEADDAEEDAEFDAEDEPEADEELAAAASAASVPAPAAVSLPLYLPDEALTDGPTEDSAQPRRRWHMAAGAALAASILAALFALPDDWVRQQMISSEDLVVSQDLDLRTVTSGDRGLTEANQATGQGPVKDEEASDDATSGVSPTKKDPYIIPASTALDGSSTSAKVPQPSKGTETTLAAAVPGAEVIRKQERNSVPGEERFLIQLATLRTQEQAAELRIKYEERFKILLADFGLGVRATNIAGAQYFRVMTELGAERERMFDICTQIKNEDQSCILVLDTPSQAQAVN